MIIHNADVRFAAQQLLIEQMILRPGVRGIQLSNPGVLQTVALRGSLEVFGMTSMEKMRAKSLLLTGMCGDKGAKGPRPLIRTPE